MTAVAAPTPRTCVWLFPDRPANELVALIGAAEDLGIDEVWLGDEGPAREPFAVLAAAARATRRIGLGIAVTNPYVRAPALTVTTALTVDELSGGRMLLGVGAGGQLSLGPFGLDAASPVRAVTDFIDTARAVTARRPGPGYSPSEHAIDGLGRGLAGALPVYVGARGPRLNRLASERADGVFVAGMPPFRYQATLEAARSVRPVRVVLCPGVAFTEASLEAQRPQMIWGLLDTPAAVRERLDLDHDEVRAACAAMRDGDGEPARRLVTPAVAAELTLTGTPEQVGDGLTTLVASHRPDTIGLAITEHEGAADLERAAAAFAAMRDRLGGP